MTTCNATLYQRVGGERTLREFVVHLYRFMQNQAEVQAIREMHSTDLSHTQERLFLFLSGMLGGPSLYEDAFGAPRMRRRHMHLSIGHSERDQWLLCAQHAAEQLTLPPALRNELMQRLNEMADHLRNQDEMNVSLPMSCPAH